VVGASQRGFYGPINTTRGIVTLSKSM
jgi:hypothetical protein